MKSYNYLVKICVAVCFFYFQWISSIAQDQRIADSLVKIYQEATIEDSTKFELLRNLAFNEVNDLELSLKYAEELIALSKVEDNALYLFRGYLQKGNSTRRLGDLEIALDAFFKAGEAAIKAQFIAGEGSAYTSIADTYSEMGNSNNAEAYYNKAITLLRKIDDSVSIAIALLNAGDQYLKDKKYDAAIAYFEEAGRISENINYLSGTIYYLGNMGMVYAEQGKDELAKANLNQAITMLDELQDYSPITEYLTTMSDIYAKQQDFTTAFSYANSSLELATAHSLKEPISAANLQLSELYEQSGNLGESFKYYKNHIAYRDSVKSIATVQQMADLRTNFEVSQKQIALDLISHKKANQQIIFIAIIIIAGLTIILLLTLYWYYRAISREKKISEKLLLNILPAETAEELKKSGKVKAKKFNSVTVLFTDFKGFTRLAGNLSPEKLVESVDYYFSKFDEIMGRYRLEKIKTIGDSYMCVGGLHYHKTHHALKMVLAAFEIAEFVGDCKKQISKNEICFDMRIGINTGPVVAGVVGKKKFAYDIWGDTVNIASHMESNSEPGKINISENTYELIKDKFDCEYRGEIEVKNKGMMKMYYVNNTKDKTMLY